MRRILNLAVFCGLLSALQGKEPGVRIAFNTAEVENIVSKGLVQNNFLQNALKSIQLPELELGKGLFGLVKRAIGLKISNVDLKSIKMGSLLGNTIKKEMNTKLDFIGNLLHLPFSLIRGVVNLKLRTAYKIVNFAKGDFQIVPQECGGTLEGINIVFPGSKLLSSVKTLIEKFLTSALPRLVCPQVNKAVNNLKDTFLKTVNVDFPLGPYGTVRYRLWGPLEKTSTFGGVYLSTEILVPGRGTLSIPDDSPPFNVPSVQNYKTCMGLHPAFLNIAIFALTRIKVLQSPSTAELKNAIESLIPAEGSGEAPEPLPPSSILYIRTSIVEGPKIVFESGNPLVKLIVQLKVFTRTKRASEMLLLVMKDNIVLDPVFSVDNGGLKIALTISSHDLLLESSDSGISQVSSLVPHVNSLLSNTLVSRINGRLDTRIPLPEPVGISLKKASIQAFPDSLVLCI